VTEAQAPVDAEALGAENAALTEHISLLEAALRKLPFGVVVAEAPSGRVLATSAHADDLVRRGDRHPQSLRDYDRFEGFRPDGSPLGPGEWPIVRSLTTGEVVIGEVIESVLDDGTHAVHQFTSTPIRNDADEIVGAVATFEDATDRERRTRAEREFVTNAAHELRTPLTVIASAVEVLKAGAKDDPEARDRFLDHIDGATDRLGRLGRALLTLARTQTGQESAKLDVVALRPLLESVAEEVEPQEGVAVVVNCGSDLAALANRDLLEQALSNVARNAATHTVSGSISLAARSDDGSVSIEVIDTGTGVSSEDRERITERFYRAAGNEVEGAGLGLSIAAESVRAMGGTLELEAVEPHGACVRVRLPLARLVSA
jgi:two-component system phosphate regulon sensor histidine kinase PhoR